MMMKMSLIPLLFSLLSMINLFPPTTASSQPDIILQTCRRLSDRSPNVNYTICVTSLSSVPLSHLSDLRSLGVIALNLAAANAIDVQTKVKNLLKTPPKDRYTKSCLETCLAVYTDGISSLKDSVTAMKAGHYNDANVWISSAVDVPGTCEDGFTDGNITSPLVEENKGFFQLAVIAIGIEALLG